MKDNHCTSKELKILMVAPQPFFSARGTPFSVLHRIRALTSKGHKIDLITYPIGEDIEMDGLEILRTRGIPFINKVIIGPSIPKIFLDMLLYFKTVSALKKKKYDVIHSHEEAAFFCVGLAKKYSLIHVYDMHSSLPQQLSNFKAFNFRFFVSLFERLENYVLETCDGVITICDDLAKVASLRCQNKPHKMIENFGDDSEIFKPADDDLETALAISGKYILLYTGTFEAYQGLDLLLESMVRIKAANPEVVLILVGGSTEQVKKYKEMATGLNIEDNVRFTGTLHPSRIPNFLQIANIIVSPRSRGTNTPLKIYGYLRTGIPIVATDLYTHTQILNEDIAVLVPATVEGIASGVNRLIEDRDYAMRISKQSLEFAEKNFSDQEYIDMVSNLYEEVLISCKAKVATIES